VLGYTVGYLANALPIPGGVGVLDAGLTGALVLYGASPARAAAAVLVYHAVAFWIPALGGVIAYSRLRPRLLEGAARYAPAVHSLSPALEGGSDDSPSLDDPAHAGRLGRVHDGRSRARPLPRNRGPVARPALRPPAGRPLRREPEHPV
jgi:hypothetical protein